MKWRDVFELKSSKNIRGEDVFDVYRKGTEEMLWADIPAATIEQFLNDMFKIIERTALEELEEILAPREGFDPSSPD